MKIILRRALSLIILLSPIVARAVGLVHYSDDATARAAIKPLVEQYGQSRLRPETAAHQHLISNMFLADFGLDESRNLQQSPTIACEASDLEGDGVACLIQDYPTSGFSTGLLGCPVGTHDEQSFFECNGGCIVFHGDLDDGNFCGGCVQCSNHKIGYDCTNIATGPCTFYSCETGKCSSISGGGALVPAPTPGLQSNGASNFGGSAGSKSGCNKVNMKAGGFGVLVGALVFLLYII